MFAKTRWALIPAVLAGWLCLALPAQAVTPDVKDQGSFFSAEAVRKANAVIAEIKRVHNKDLVIETYPTVPGDQADKVRQMSPQARNQFFRDWLAERARAQKVDGVFILINREPGNLQVDTGKETARRHFTQANEKELSRLLLRKFEEKKFDEGLLEAVDYVNDTMRANVKTSGAPAARPANKPRAEAPVAHEGGGFNWGGLICMGLLVLGGVWLVVGLVRAFTGGGGGGFGGGGGYGGGGGGGFFTSLLGGMFGAAAGMWMYNSFFGGGSSFGSQAYGSESGAGGASDEGQGFGDGSGGDLGDGGSSGGDWGGGDTGGGDWGGGGGGDWGGGGGDFGGGGGDW